MLGGDLCQPLVVRPEFNVGIQRSTGKQVRIKPFRPLPGAIAPVVITWR